MRVPRDLDDMDIVLLVIAIAIDVPLMHHHLPHSSGSAAELPWACPVVQPALIACRNDSQEVADRPASQHAVDAGVEASFALGHATSVPTRVASEASHPRCAARSSVER